MAPGAGLFPGIRLTDKKATRECRQWKKYMVLRMYFC